MKKILLLSLALLLFSACNDRKNRSIYEDVSAFIEKNQSISYFGYVDVKSILEKSDYESIEKIGAEIAKEVKLFDKLISKNQPIFIAVEGPSDLESNVPLMYVFAEVTNRDSLVSNIQKKGFDIEKSKMFDLHESGDVAFAITDNRVIFITKPGLNDGKKIIEKAIESLNSESPDNKVKDILSTEGDIVIGLDLTATYSNFKNFTQMEESKKKELEEITKNSYSQMVVKFETGAVDIEIKNFVTDELKEYYGMASDAKEVTSKLGSGPVQAAFVMNTDMRKIQDFINRFSPNLLDEIGRNAGGEAQFALAMLGDEGIAGLFSGKLGIALMGKPDITGAFKPEFNFYMELGNSVLPMAKGMIGGFSASMAKIDLVGSKLNGFTSSSFLPGKGRLNLPKGCENFGKNPICGFVNFEGLDMSNFDLDGNERYLNLFQFLTVDMDSDGGLIHLEVKNKQKNVLKILVDEASQDIKDRVNS
jgi:hypothetical protein